MDLGWLYKPIPQTFLEIVWYLIKFSLPAAYQNLYVLFCFVLFYIYCIIGIPKHRKTHISH